MANPTPSSTSSLATGDVHDKAAEAVSQAKHKASDLAETAKSAAADRLDDQKRHATGALSDVADALHDTSDSLRDHDQDAFARYAEAAASQVETLTQTLRTKNVGELIDDVERFARRDAGLFIGGAFLLGILGGRFLKASAPSSSRSGSYTSREFASRPYRPTTGSEGYGSSSYGAGTTTPGGYGSPATPARSAEASPTPYPTGTTAGGAVPSVGASPSTGGPRATSPNDSSR